MTRPFSRSLRLSDHHESKNSKWSWAAYTLLFAITLNAHAQGPSDQNAPEPDQNEPKTIHGSVDLDLEGRNDGGIHVNYIVGKAPETPEEKADFEQKTKGIADAIGAPLKELEFSDELESKIEETAEKSKRIRTINGVAVTPRTSADHSAGILWGTVGGISTAIVFYPDHGIFFGTTATLWSVVVGYLFNAYHITLDDLFLKGLDSVERRLTKHYFAYSTHDVETSQLSREKRLDWAKDQANSRIKLLYYVRVLLFDFAVTHVGNAFSGLPKTPLQTTIDVALLMGLQNIHGVQRNNILRENRALRHTYQLITKPIISVVRAFQDSNKTARLFAIGSYPITQSLGVAIGIYLTLITVNTVAPKVSLNAVKATNRAIQRLGESIIVGSTLIAAALTDQYLNHSVHDDEDWDLLTQAEKTKRAEGYGQKSFKWLRAIGTRIAAMGVVANITTKLRDCKTIAEPDPTDRFAGEVDLP